MDMKELVIAELNAPIAGVDYLVENDEEVSVRIIGLEPDEDSVDMDEVQKNEDSEIPEDPDKEPDSSLGEDSEIEEESDKEPDSELDE